MLFTSKTFVFSDLTKRKNFAPEMVGVGAGDPLPPVSTGVLEDDIMVKTKKKTIINEMIL